MRLSNLFFILTLILLFVAQPTLAGSRRYAVNLMEDWEISTESAGYEIFYSIVDVIDEDHSVSYYFDLAPGWYYFVAEGGEDIEDIDMYVYDEDGYELASDTYDDNYPICEVEVPYSMEIEVEIIPYSFFGRVYEDYFCFVAGSDTAGYGDPVRDWGPGGDTDEIMDYWIDWAEDMGFDVIYTGVGSLSSDRSEFFQFDLDGGYYHIYAESLNEDDDIDMYIWDDNDYELDSDSLSDNYPICEFEIQNPENIEIEVVPYDYGHGRSTDFCIVMAVDGDGGILGGDTGPVDQATVTDRADLEYINEVLAEYMERVQHHGYDMIYDEIDTLNVYDGSTVTITVGRGDYIVYAEGGLRIEDLDLYVYDEDGYLVSEDSLIDNIPVCEFSTHRSATFEIEIEAYEMEGRWDEGYYLLVIVKE